MQDRYEIRNESIQLGLVGKVAIEGQKYVESANDGRRANAIANVGADEGKNDESGSICSVDEISDKVSSSEKGSDEPSVAPPETGRPSKPGMCSRRGKMSCMGEKGQVEFRGLAGCSSPLLAHP